MKTFCPNQIINQPGIVKLSGKLIKTMKHKLLLMFLLFLSGFSIQAQQALVSNAEIKQVDAFLASVAVAGQVSRPERLIKDNQPSVYFDAGAVTVRGTNPVNLYTTAAALNSIGSIDTSSFDASKIEMITIKVTQANELAGGIDLSVLAGFTNLKYIYVLSEASVQPNDITRSIRNTNPNYSVFYSISKPS